MALILVLNHLQVKSLFFRSEIRIGTIHLN